MLGSELLNNAPCGAQLVILDSPKGIGDLLSGQIAAPTFTIQMAAGRATARPSCACRPKSGRTIERVLATRNVLNSDELSYYFDGLPDGGTEWADWPATTTLRTRRTRWRTAASSRGRCGRRARRGSVHL